MTRFGLKIIIVGLSWLTNVLRAHLWIRFFTAADDAFD